MRSRRGLDVVDFPIAPYVEVAGEQTAVSHMNFYLCNSAVIVPVAGVPSDGEALERLAAAYPDRELVRRARRAYRLRRRRAALHHPAGPGQLAGTR